MSDLNYFTNEKNLGPWLIDSNAIAALDKVIDDLSKKYSILFDGVIEKISQNDNITDDVKEKWISNFTKQFKLKRNLNVVFKQACLIEVEAFKDLQIKREYETLVPEYFTYGLECFGQAFKINYELRFENSITVETPTKESKFIADAITDNDIKDFYSFRKEFFENARFAINVWIENYRPRIFLRWWHKIVDLAIIIVPIWLYFIIIVLPPIKVVENKSELFEKINKLLQNGIQNDKINVALEYLLRSVTEGKDTIYYIWDLSYTKIIFYFFFVFFIILIIFKPRPIIGILANTKKLKMRMRWVHFVTVALPTNIGLLLFDLLKKLLGL